ncbi:MAG: hypothetical protein WC449_05970 [Candidatus Paceibacterota bacterium]
MNESPMVRLSPNERIQMGDIIHFSLGKNTGTRVVKEIGENMTVGEFKKYLYDEQPIDVYRSNVLL